MLPKWAQQVERDLRERIADNHALARLLYQRAAEVAFHLAPIWATHPETVGSQESVTLNTYSVGLLPTT